MATKRESSSQKRQRANRAQREALSARSTAAGTPRPSRQPPVAARRTGGEVKAARTAAEATGGSVAAGKTGGGGVRPKRERRPRLGDAPVDIATLEGSWIRRVMQVPGGSQVLMGFALSLLSTVFLATARSVPKAGTPKGAKHPELVTIIDRFGLPQGLLILAIPSLIAGIAVAGSLRARRRRIWLGSAVALAIVVLFGASFYLFSVGLIGYGIFRASKVEGPGDPLVGYRRRRTFDGDGDGDGDRQRGDDGDGQVADN